MVLVVGDRYLLCSDGLSDYVSGGVIEEVLAEADTPERARRASCVEVALKASTRDNVTVVAADVVDLDATDNPPPTTRSSARPGCVMPQPHPRHPGQPGREGRDARPQRDRQPGGRRGARCRPCRGDPHEGHPGHPPRPARAAPGRPVRRRRLRRLLLDAEAPTVGVADGKVALFQGVATNLGPVPLSSLASTSTVAVSDLPEYYRETVTKTFTVRDTTGGSTSGSPSPARSPTPAGRAWTRRRRARSRSSTPRCSCPPRPGPTYPRRRRARRCRRPPPGSLAHLGSRHHHPATRPTPGPDGTGAITTEVLN